MRTRSLLLLPVLLLAALPSAAAGGIQWTFEGVPLTRAAGGQDAPQLASDSAGGAIAVWYDDRTGNPGIGAQRVGAGGTIAAGWPADGLLLATSTGGWPAPSIVADGESGAFVAWVGGADGPPLGIHVRRLLGDGTVAPWGLVPFDSPNAGSRPLLTRTSAGAVFVTWGHDLGTGYAVRVQRLEADGSPSPGWPADGLSLDRGSRSEYPQGIIADTSGGVLVLSTAFAGDQDDLVLHHVTADGRAAPGFPDSGLVVQRGAGQSLGKVIVPDGAGGAIVSWWRNTGGAGAADIFAQRITGTGEVAPGWPAGGVTVCGAPGDQVNPVLVADGGAPGGAASGAVIAWLDLRDHDIFAQRITADGQRAPGWPADGAPVCTAPGLQYAQVLAPDGAGGAIAAWVDGRNGSGAGRDIYAQHVTGAGAVAAGWPEQGLAVCEDPADQVEPAIVPVGGTPGEAAGGAIVAWTDDRNAGSGYDVYAAAVTAAGEVRSDARAPLTLLPPRPNPGGRRIRLDLDVVARGLAGVRLDIVDPAGRRVRRLYAGDPGPGRVSCWWDARDDNGREVRAGLYFAYAHFGANGIERRGPARRIALSR